MHHPTVCLSCGWAEMVWCNSCTLLMSLSYDISITVSSTLHSLLPYLFLLYYFAHPLFLSLVSVSNASGFICLCVCHLTFSPFFPPFPSLSQTVDWYGNTRLCVFLALPQMGPWQHVRDQNVLYLSCQAVPQDQNGSRPLWGEDGEGEKPPFPFLHSLNWGFNYVFWHG